MNQKLAMVLFAFAFVVAIVVGFGGRDDLRPKPAEFRAKFQETLLKSRKRIDPVAVPTPLERNPSSGALRRPAGEPESKPGDPLTREQFARKYGESLVITEFEKRVIRIDGSGIPSEKFDASQKVGGFRPSNSNEVSARALEVFESVRRILGIPDHAEFIAHPPTTGDSTAQIVIQQTENGIPIAPGGLVTILLGPEGEVRAIDSSIYPKTEVVNTATLPRPEAARQILFVTQSSPTAVLHHAYETRDRGIQKVVDAQTGTVLLEKDRRIR